MTFSPDDFKKGDEVLIVKYPDKEVLGCTGTVTRCDGLYWQVDLNTIIDGDETPYLFETVELELINQYYKYNPDQAGDLEDDI
jgi:hypothetical protein